RDPLVTGVQTCALPILDPSTGATIVAGTITSVDGRRCRFPGMLVGPDGTLVEQGDTPDEAAQGVIVVRRHVAASSMPARQRIFEIGRASCRERVWVPGG